MAGNNCPNWISWVILIAGILYLLADLSIFNWGISWYTTAFILVGLCYIANK